MIRISFTLHRADLLDAFRAHQAQTGRSLFGLRGAPRTILSLTLFVAYATVLHALLFNMIILLFYPRFAGNSWISPFVAPDLCLGLGIFGFLTATVAIKTQMYVRRVHAQSLCLLHPQEWELDDNAVRVTSADGVAFQYWHAFNRFSETNTLFLLYRDEYHYQIVPKRAFSSPELLTQFRSLLQLRIQPPTGGFPVEPPNPQTPCPTPAATPASEEKKPVSL